MGGSGGGLRRRGQSCPQDAHRLSSRSPGVLQTPWEPPGRQASPQPQGVAEPLPWLAAWLRAEGLALSLLRWLKPREALGKKVGLSRQTQPPRTGLSPREMSLSCLQAAPSLIPLSVGSSKCIVSTNLRAAVFRGARGKGRGRG